jgi:hypothetical protein
MPKNVLAHEALLALAIQDLQRIDSLGKLAEAVAMIASLPAEGAEYLPAGWQEVRRRITVGLRAGSGCRKPRPATPSRPLRPLYV